MTKELISFPAGEGDFSITSRPALRPINPPIHEVPPPVSLGVNRLEREADHLPPSSVEVKNGGVISPLPIHLIAVMLN
jgi:hypothetical protein